MESAASGLLAARCLYARLQGRTLPLPPADTMCGALMQYLVTENKNFQPMGANMGILPPLPPDSRPGISACAIWHRASGRNPASSSGWNRPRTEAGTPAEREQQ